MFKKKDFLLHAKNKRKKFNYNSHFYFNSSITREINMKIKISFGQTQFLGTKTDIRTQIKENMRIDSNYLQKTYGFHLHSFLILK